MGTEEDQENKNNSTAWSGLALEWALHVAADCSEWRRWICDAASPLIENDGRQDSTNRDFHFH